MRPGPGTSGVVEYEVPGRESDGKGELTSLITTVTDPRHAPAGMLAQACHTLRLANPILTSTAA